MCAYHALLDHSINHTIFFLFIQWLKHDFLSYLDEWEASSQAQDGLSQAEKNKLCISRETLEGLRITGWTLALYCNTIININPPL